MGCFKSKLVWVCVSGPGVEVKGVGGYRLPILLVLGCDIEISKKLEGLGLFELSILRLPV